MRGFGEASSQCRDSSYVADSLSSGVTILLRSKTALSVLFLCSNSGTQRMETSDQNGELRTDLNTDWRTLTLVTDLPVPNRCVCSRPLL